MDSIYVKIMFLLVAVGALLFYFTNSYQPTMEASSSIASKSNQTLTIISQSFESSSAIQSPSTVINYVTSTCVSGNTKTVTVILKTATGSVSSGSYSFTTSNTSASKTVSEIVGTKQFNKVENGNSVTFTEI